MDYFPISRGLKIEDSTSFWNGLEISFPAITTSIYFNDFFEFNNDAATGPWLITETQAAATQLIGDEANGVLVLTNSAADNDLNSVQKRGESWNTAAGRTLWYETSFKLADATQTDCINGLMVTDTTPFSTTDGIFFQKDDDGTRLDLIVVNSSLTTAVRNIHTMTNAAYVKAGFKVVGTSYLEYWINGVKAGVLNVPLPTTELTATISLMNGEAVAKTMSVDYLNIAQTR